MALGPNESPLLEKLRGMMPIDPLIGIHLETFKDALAVVQNCGLGSIRTKNHRFNIYEDRVFKPMILLEKISSTNGGLSTSTSL